MTVRELVEKLKTMPEDSEVWFGSSYEIKGVTVEVDSKGPYVFLSKDYVEIDPERDCR